MAKSGKKIFFISLIYFLVIAGLIAATIVLYVDFQESNPFSIPYGEMVAFAPLIVAVLIALQYFSFVKKCVKERSMGKTKTGWSLKTGIFAIIFIFAWAPFVLPLFDDGLTTKHHSIYNPDWNGCSTFKQTIETEGYTVRSIQSSLSTISRLSEEQGNKLVLCIMGPNRFYNPVSELPFLIDFFANGGSVLICHDHGSTQWLLIEMALASFGATPFAFFSKGVLRDNASFYKRPDFPVITRFSYHATTNGISRVVLSRGGAILGGEFLDFFGMNALGTTSDRYSWVDKNDDQIFTSAADSFSIPSIFTDFLEQTAEAKMEEYGLEGADWEAPDSFPMGGYAQTVFTYSQSGNNRAFLSCDASMFNNELMSSTGYDNAQFARNIINWLANPSASEQKSDYWIVFDEAHIRPEGGFREISSSAFFGLIIGYVNWLSTNVMFAWIYPFLAIYTLRKWLPKSERKLKKLKEKEEKSRAQERMEQEIEFRTRSFFARKIDWYKEGRKYNEALTLLFRRVQRQINSQLEGREFNVDNVLQLVEKKIKPDITRSDLNRLKKFLTRMKQVRKSRIAHKIKDEDEFRDLFYTMIWASEIFEPRERG